MRDYQPNAATEDFLLAMKHADMVPTCPQCGTRCFCPAVAQTKASMAAGTLLLWCLDHHWAGDVREATWKHIDQLPAKP